MHCNGSKQLHVMFLQLYLVISPVVSAVEPHTNSYILKDVINMQILRLGDLWFNQIKKATIHTQECRKKIYLSLV